MRDGKMCGRHKAMWTDWAGGPDGWGPHNPIPPGVTMKLADEQRAMILGWCKQERGCGEQSTEAEQAAHGTDGGEDQR